MLSGVSSATHKNPARCWLFERGQCHRGSSCRFLHTVESSSSHHQDESAVSKQDSPPHAEAQASSISVKPCRHFFHTGWCGYGSSCRFAHSKTSATNETCSERKDIEPEAAAATIVSSAQNDGQIPAVENASHGDNDAGMILIKGILFLSVVTI